MIKSNVLKLEVQCYHCGEDLPEKPYLQDEKPFCCLGCKGVYQVLINHNLGDYYAYNDVPGQTQKQHSSHFEYLDEPTVAADLFDYSDGRITVISLYIPAIHCSSCIWLLENLYKVNPDVVQSRVDFLKKQVNITFTNSGTTLRKLVESLSNIGYEPLITLQDVVKEQQNTNSDRQLIKKIAVAGFCFGNTMLLSFPEYFGLSSFEQEFKYFFGLLNLAFSVPVVFYCGRDYFISAYISLKKRILNLDFPLALGIAVMFVRSIAEVLTKTGAGFVDTLCGLVFFLLIGKWMQQHTYHHLSFERDYRSYFPVAVTTINNGIEKPLPLNQLKKGDRILIRNEEIIPADAILLKGSATLDFSFVTGESIPVAKVLGEILYAGGRQLGGLLELEVIKPVSQGYLTMLWNNEAFISKKDQIKTFSGTASKYFSIVLLLIATSSGIFWIFEDASKALAAFTAVLIIACPCALALSAPFTLAAVLSVFDRNKFYLKNTAVIEELARIDTFVFDKTGTITNPKAGDLKFIGQLSQEQKQWMNDLARNSGHPLSREFVKWINLPHKNEAQHYREQVGRGISGYVNGHYLQMGSAVYLELDVFAQPNCSHTHIQIDGNYLGYFLAGQQWRNGFKELAHKLGSQADLHLLSGDQDHDAQSLTPFFTSLQHIHFKQTPQMKLDYIKNLQLAERKVIMFGDGLNDAGALKQSNIGVAVTDNINNFSPGCDAILDGTSFSKIPLFMKQAKDAVRIIHMSFGISVIYNLIGLSFAVQGLLSPLIAAVLMPISTVTIILFTSTAARIYARKNKLL
jgi:Cu+-exporting ATPase